MEIYKNLSGQSNIAQYGIGQDYIDIEFKTKNRDGCDTYRYSCSRIDRQDIEHMKQLAIVGRGLNSFIMSHVRKLYDRKW